MTLNCTKTLICERKSLISYFSSDPSLFKVVCLIEVPSKFIKKKRKTAYFCYILFFQFALINNQPNIFFQPCALITFA